MRFTIFTAFVLFLLFLPGCGGSKNPYGTVHVLGTVTLDGEPLEGAFVTLIPHDGEYSAGGITDAQGKFTVNTGGYNGAKPGTYNVTITKVKHPEEALSFQEFMKKYKGGAPPPVYLIPQRYENSKTSGIEPITVDSNKANNKFAFAITSK